MISVDRYLAYVTSLLIWCGVVFELPAVLYLLAKVGIVTPQFLREQRHTRLMAEMERFRAQHAELLEVYRGQFVGFYDGKVLDRDEDGGALYARLRHQHGDLPILIVQVTETPEQEVTVRNPKLETTE